MPPFPFKHPWFVIGTVTAVVLVGATFFMQRPQDVDDTTNVHGDPDSLDNAGTTTTQGDAAGKQSTTTPAHTTSLPFPSLNTVEERQRYYDTLIEEPAEALWRKWRQFLDLGDYNSDDSDLTRSALIEQLRHDNNTNDTVYAAARDVLNQPSVVLDQKKLVVGLLSPANTPEALSILLDMATRRSNEDALRPFVLAGISQTGNDLWDARFHPELSPPLEAVWDTEVSEDLLNAVAVAIAKVGAPSGIRLLLETIDDDGLMNAKAFSASSAISRFVRNPEAIPPLKDGLQRELSNKHVFIASGTALARMPYFEAGTALIAWAQKAPDSDAPLAQEWFRSLGDTKARQLLKDLLTTNATFQSEVVRQTVAQVLTKSETVIFDQ